MAIAGDRLRTPGLELGLMPKSLPETLSITSCKQQRHQHSYVLFYARLASCRSYRGTGSLSETSSYCKRGVRIELGIQTEREKQVIMGEQGLVRGGVRSGRMPTDNDNEIAESSTRTRRPYRCSSSSDPNTLLKFGPPATRAERAYTVAQSRHTDTATPRAGRARDRYSNVTVVTEEVGFRIRPTPLRLQAPKHGAEADQSLTVARRAARRLRPRFGLAMEESRKASRLPDARSPVSVVEGDLGASREVRKRQESQDSGHGSLSSLLRNIPARFGRKRSG